MLRGGLKILLHQDAGHGRASITGEEETSTISAHLTSCEHYGARRNFHNFDSARTSWSSSRSGCGFDRTSASRDFSWCSSFFHGADMDQCLAESTEVECRRVLDVVRVLFTMDSLDDPEHLERRTTRRFTDIHHDVSYSSQGAVKRDGLSVLSSIF